MRTKEGLNILASKIVKLPPLSETEFWTRYTERVQMSTEDMDAYYLNLYGITRTDIDTEFMGKMDRYMSILEVGCGTGMQLQFLRNMGFDNLTGLERLQYARDIASNDGFHIFCGDAEELPFEDAEFDMVFTSGLLIHIPPEKLPKVMSEIYRCSKRWIWGLEYWGKDIIPIPYRSTVCWKADYTRIFLSHFDNLRLVKETHFPRQDKYMDTVYLLEKIIVS